MKKPLNIALFSPNKDAYSETFIQAHKNHLKGNIFFYYGVGEAIALENHSPLSTKIEILILKIIKNIFKKSNEFIHERLLIRSLKKNCIDVVLVEYGIHAAHLLSAIKKSKLPLVVHFHGYDAAVRKIIKEHNNYRDVFQYASKVIAVSRSMEKQLLNMGCPRVKLIYNANAAQTVYNEIESDFSQEQFISIGRFANKKAPYYIILSFCKVLETHPKARLIMCGDGVLFEPCVNLVKHFGFEDQIQFSGATSSEQIQALFSNSLGFIQHSITAKNGDMEGMPISVLEASAAGLPVISTYHGGIVDVIEHGVTGLLSNEHDVDDMAKNIIRLLDDKDYAMSLGKAGKQRIKTHFSFERHINGIQDSLETSVKL